MEMFLFGLLVCSTLTGLFTEAVKKILKEHRIKFYANTLTGFIALVVSAFVGIGYIIFAGITVTMQTIAALVTLVVMSWLCAMLGYDKVVQALIQFKDTGKEGKNHDEK